MKHTVREVTLKNGLTGLIIDVPDAKVVYTEINFRAGEYLLPKAKWETAHLMEHLLLGANKRFPKARDFQAEIEKNGAYCNASTGVYDITYEAECADFEWQRVLELLLVAISEPLFLEEEFIAEVGNVREELVGRSNNHFRHLSIALRQKMGLVAMVDQKRVKLMKSVNLADVARHYKQTHTIQNARFVIAGRLKNRTASLEKLFNSYLTLPSGSGRTDLPKERPKRIAKPLLIRRSHVPNLYFYIDTYTRQPLPEPARDSLLVATTILTETLYSRILGKARARGLVYAMGSGQNTARDCHNWWVGAQVSVTNAPVLFRLIRDELSAVLAGQLSRQELQAASQYLIGKHLRSGQTVSGIVSGYSSTYFLQEEIEDYPHFDERMRAVSLDELQATFNTMFAEQIWGLAVLGHTKLDNVRELAGVIEPLWQK